MAWEVAFPFTFKDSVAQPLCSYLLGWSEGKNMHCCLYFIVQVAMNY